jgi:hypothetical protein
MQKGATRGTRYREIARLRIDDAKALLAAKRDHGAIYLAGYAIECHLKFAVCERNSCVELPAELETHDWDRLIDAAGLHEKLNQQRSIATIYAALSELWGPELRYRTKSFGPREGGKLYNEMEELYQFLKELVP